MGSAGRYASADFFNEVLSGCKSLALSHSADPTAGLLGFLPRSLADLQKGLRGLSVKRLQLYRGWVQRMAMLPVKYIVLA